MIKEAIILAGGFGTRLRKVINDIPKPMAPINGEPFLSFVFDYLHKFGIEHIILSVGYKHEIISEFYGKKYKDIKLSYAVEDEPLGTGGAIKFAMNFAKSNEVFVLNGDTLFNINLNLFFKKHTENQADLSMALRSIDEVERYGTVITNKENRIISFTEKGIEKGQGTINGGVYIIPIDFFKKIANFTTRFSMETDVFEKYYKENYFQGVVFNSYFIDIGIPDDYSKAQTELLNILS